MNFITIEGIEGVGKTTAMKFAESFFQTHKKDFILTREPGGTAIAEQIRQILLTPETTVEAITANTELLLMFAARAQHIQYVIKPALQTGKWVISDRYVDASFAYQGGGRGISENTIAFLEEWIVADILPVATIILDAPAEIGLARAKNRSAHDRIEQEKVDFFVRVREAYLMHARKNPHRYYIIDATKPLESVEQALIQVFTKVVLK
ncbi:thymidylate kinase [Gammaproteobacteria bacterium SCGC AG-212-F23]|nr:thymidylate kinase [Gammaproteobacteria bacterium SCGC AG-212-F23]